MTTSPLQSHLDSLQLWFRQFPSALIAYSGGTDSALVMLLAHRFLPPSKILACIGVSPSYPQREQQAALQLAQQFNIPCQLIQTLEHQNPDYAANPTNRCYFCKSELYSQLSQIAQSQNYAVILDGTNADDLLDHRPGRTAASEHHIRSPLAELHLSKSLVRQLAQHLSLPIWDKPAMACLASRIPHGTPVTPTLLQQIEQAENALFQLGFRQFRVRHHQNLARIELLPDDLPKALQLRSTITQQLKAIGYQHITLDLAAFRTSDSPLPILNKPQDLHP